MTSRRSFVRIELELQKQNPMIIEQVVPVKIDVLRLVRQAKNQWETSVAGDNFGYLNDAGDWVIGIELEDGSHEDLVRSATSEELKIHAAFKTVMEVVKGKEK